jgi:hypothetical protein
MFERDALLLLARAYRDRTGIGPYALGTKCGNTRLFVRLARGQGISNTSSERALLWFAAKWPHDLPWPRSVYRPAVQDDARAAPHTVAAPSREPAECQC